MSMAGGGRVDFGFLERLAAGDQGLMREVLDIFLAEAEGWAARLEKIDGAAAADIVHTVKGSGRAIGAHALGDLCEDWETGEIDDLGPVRAELNDVVAEVRAWLAG